MVAGALDMGIDLNAWPWVWLGAAVVFALVELLVVGGSFIILPWSASAFVAAIMAFYDAPIEAQWIEFAFGGAVLFLVLYKWARKFTDAHQPTPGVGAERLVGLTAIVTTEIHPDDVDRRGRVRIGAEEWGAISDVHNGVPVGAKVKVVAMKGTRVVVEPLPVSDAP